MVETLQRKSYDIVVIGAGPAGSSAARAASQRGADVLMIDRRQRIGIPVQCAEFVPQWISRYVHFSSRCILQTVETMVTHLPDGTSYEMKSPGYMLDRSFFDKELVASAILSGAKISIETKAVGLSTEGLVVEQGSKKDKFKQVFMVPTESLLHSSLCGQPLLKTIVALRYEVVLPETSESCG
jgi:flavin-dependent dehydrogenase